jgi:hypothetical protein
LSFAFALEDRTVSVPSGMTVSVARGTITYCVVVTVGGFVQCSACSTDVVRYYAFVGDVIPPVTFETARGFLSAFGGEYELMRDANTISKYLVSDLRG